jgi:hypothetical protein
MQVAAVAGVVGHDLRRRPAIASCALPWLSRWGGRPASRIAAVRSVVSSVIASAPSPLSRQIGHGRRIAIRARRRRNAERGERLRRDHPGRDRGGKVLGQNGPSGWYSQAGYRARTSR